MDRASGGELEEEATENEAPGKQLDEQLPKLMAKNQLGGSKLQIVRLIGPESAQNGTQNVTIGKFFKQILRSIESNLMLSDLLTPPIALITNLSPFHPRPLDAFGSFETLNQIACSNLTRNWIRG